MIERQSKLLFAAFMSILMGVVLIVPIGDQVENVQVASYDVTNESVSLTSGVGTLNYDELVSVSACRNSSMSVVALNSDCNITLSTGALQGVATNFSDNLAYVDYTYEPDTYVHSGSARTMLDLTIILFALALMAVGVGFAIAAFKEGNLM